MDRTTLQVTPRKIVGKKVKQLRKQGLIPAHIFGYNTEPINVSVGYDVLKTTFQHSGETGLIDLQLEGQTYPVLIQNIQEHAVSGEPLNIDFHKVNLKEKVTVTIPVIPVGEPIAVEQKIGILEQPIAEVEIEALPTDLIENIEVDVATLAQIDDALYVKDLNVPEAITILTDPEEMVVKIGPLMTAEMEALEAEIEAEAEEAQAETEVSEEGEAKEETTEEGEASPEEPAGEEPQEA